MSAPSAPRPWAARLAGDVSGAALLRLLPDVLAARSVDVPPVLWLRGPDLAADVESVVRRVPGLECFLVLPGGRLVEPGRTVPQARLPELAWHKIAETFVPVPPASALAGMRPTAVPIVVRPSSGERPAVALVTAVDAWERWCTEAAEVRLRPLTFAACRDGRVLVRGAPLPAIPHAVALWGDADVLVPAGHAPHPEVAHTALRVACGAARGDVVLFAEDGAFELVPAAGFVVASRSAARLTRSGLVGL